MLRFFPFIYPDELLYSAICRYYKYTGKGSIKLSFHELFGEDTRIFSVIDFPYNIDSFISQFKTNYLYTSEEIIFNFTMLPLYYPFLKQKMQQYAIYSMKNVAGKNIYKTLGVMASSIKCLTRLKYCPDCLKEDLQNYGEVYLHRSHNLDGILVCYKHNKLLRTNCPYCDVPISPKDIYQLTPLECTCINGHDLFGANKNQDLLTFSHSDLKHHLLVSRIVNYILNLNYSNSEIDFNTLHDKYIYKLSKIDYLTVKGLIRQTQLKYDFINFYGHTFLNKLKLDINCNNRYCWLQEFLNKKNTIFHPLKHILFLIFICNNNEIEIQRFFIDDSDYSINLFGKGPWPCLNPAADHYLKNVITDYSISTAHKSREPIGIFKCSCGFIYTKHISLESENDKYCYTRIKAYGHVWKEKLSKIILNDGGTLCSIAQKMHCDSKTVKRYATELGLEFCWESYSENIVSDYTIKNKTDKENCSKLVDQYCMNIKNYILSFPTPPRIEVIRKYHGKEYGYLYKHSKEMLFNLLIPCRNNTCRITSKVNWEQRDQELLSLVSNEIKYLLSSDKLNRITINKIGRDLGISYILVQYLNKLPITRLLINNSIESVEDFQIRKIKTIANRLGQNNEPIFKTKLCRLAGMKNNCSKKVMDEITRLLKNNE